MKNNKEVTSVYIHIPFCKTICSYCAFCKMFYNELLVDQYLKAIEEEIKSHQIKTPLKTIYIGGGSPSCLTLDETKKLLDMINTLPKDKNYEYTIECNIENLEIEKLKLYKHYGINRLSIGVQTVQEKFLPYLNRCHTKEEVKKIISLAKEQGFTNINVDLIYGIPNQSIKDLLDDLKFFVKQDITHISTYSLMIEEHTKLYIDKIKPIDEELDQKMYQQIIDFLKKNNFKHYEISNFCKEGYQSRHNLVYWSNLPYYGFGLGSSGYIDNTRYTNTRSLNDYIKKKWILEQEELSKQDEMTYEMILGLRKLSGVKKERFFEKYGKRIEDVFDYQEHIDNGLLIEDNNSLKIPEDKLYLSNLALVSFVVVKKDE